MRHTSVSYMHRLLLGGAGGLLLLQAEHELVDGCVHQCRGLIVRTVPSVQVHPLCGGEQRLDAVCSLGSYPGILFA